MTKAYNYVSIDLETTGLDSRQDRIIEVGAVKYTDGCRSEDFSGFVNPDMPIPERITQITGIDDSMVEDAEDISTVLPKLLSFVGELPILGHNIMFDYGFIRQKAADIDIDYKAEGIDTHRIAKLLLPQLASRSLENLCGYYGIVEEPRHRAFSDAAAAARLYDCLYEEAKDKEDIKEKDRLFMPSPLVYSVRKDSPVTPKQAAFLKKLISLHNISYDKEIESLTKSQASREIDLILSTYGRSFR